MIESGNDNINNQLNSIDRTEINSSRAFSNAMSALQKELQNQRKQKQELQTEINAMTNLEQIENPKIIEQLETEIDGIREQNQKL